MQHDKTKRGVFDPKVPPPGPGYQLVVFGHLTSPPLSSVSYVHLQVVEWNRLGHSFILVLRRREAPNASTSHTHRTSNQPASAPNLAWLGWIFYRQTPLRGMHRTSSTHTCGLGADGVCPQRETRPSLLANSHSILISLVLVHLPPPSPVSPSMTAPFLSVEDLAWS